MRALIYGLNLAVVALVVMWFGGTTLVLNLLAFAILGLLVFGGLWAVFSR